MLNMLAGLDFSLSCPSICIFDKTSEFCHSNVLFYFNQQNPTKKEMNRWKTLNNINIFPHKQNEYTSDIERYYYLADWVLSICSSFEINTLILEGYALGAKGRVFNIAEATSLVKFLLTLRGININIIPPTLNKKIFSGSGNANKQKMIARYNDLNKINISELFTGKKDFTGSPISDIVDSYSLIYSYLKGAK